MDPRFAGQTWPTETEIHSTPFVGEEVKPSVPYRKTSRHVKEAYEFERDTSWSQFNGYFYANFFLLRY
jgi:hypothetical protein